MSLEDKISFFYFLFLLLARKIIIVVIAIAKIGIKIAKNLEIGILNLFSFMLISLKLIISKMLRCNK